MKKIKVLEEINPVRLNGELIVETPINAKSPYMVYNKEEDRFLIVEGLNSFETKEFHISFPYDNKGNLVTRAEHIEKQARTFGSVTFVNLHHPEDVMSFERIRQHIGEEMHLVTGGNLFGIDSVRVLIHKIANYSAGDGGQRIVFKVENYRQLCQVQNAFPSLIQLRDNEELTFSSKSPKLFCKLTRGGKPESPFIDATKY